MHDIVDLRSDTLTLPTPAMREAMAHAEVGDDVWEEDPTVRRLEESAARRTGKDAALFVSSGTQGNLVSVLAQTRRKISSLATTTPRCSRRTRRMESALGVSATGSSPRSSRRRTGSTRNSSNR